MYYGIYNSRAVTNLKLRGQKTILIRCLSKHEYEDKSLDILNINDYANILKLELEDKNFFDINEAKLLNDFIINNDFDEVIAHCSLGLSRSPAIMICIAKILNNLELEQKIKQNYKFYNKGIVSDFEKFPYETKEILDKNFILIDTNIKKEDAKILIK